MKYKHIEACRELRLWIVQVVAPITVFMAMCPEARQWVGNKVDEGKNKVKERLNAN